MGRFATDTGGGQEYEKAPTGTHLARCISIIDIGTHAGDFQGKPTRRNQIIIGWELPNELREDDKPHRVSKFYTNSLHEKAKLRHDLEAWRGRPFTAEELAGFDLENILGKPCMVTVIEPEQGKRKVTAVSAVPKGFQPSPQVNPSFSFWLEEWNQAKFDGLPQFIQSKIAESEEYQKRIGGYGSEAAADVSNGDQAPDDDGEPLPF